MIAIWHCNESLNYSELFWLLQGLASKHVILNCVVFAPTHVYQLYMTRRLCIWLLQGYGLYVLEEQKYTPSGYLVSRGPGMYKIPSCSDIPAVFNVTLLKDSSNILAVYSSKVSVYCQRAGLSM